MLRIIKNCLTEKTKMLVKGEIFLDDLVTVWLYVRSPNKVDTAGLFPFKYFSFQRFQESKFGVVYSIVDMNISLMIWKFKFVNS